MHYTDFEDEIHALILERGRQYYDSGAVSALSRTPDGWSSEVEGSENDIYHVIVHGDDDISEWHCDCPYDRGPICKHVVATLYAIRDIIVDEDAEDDGESDEMETMIDDIEDKVLLKFMKDQLVSSPEFRDTFREYLDEEE